MIAVIMAGGKGTRLSPVSSEIPKPMFPIVGKPILEHQIGNLSKSGIKKIIIIVGYLKDKIIEYFGDGRKFGVRIDYIEEKEPLGTAGALFYLKDLEEDFLLVFGDLVFDVDFSRFIRFHKEKMSWITLFGHPNSHPYDSDLIEINQNNQVTRLLSKKAERNFYYHNFVNSGLYCINPRALFLISSAVKTDLDKDLVSAIIGMGKVFAYKSTEYIKDMGTPDRLVSVSRDLSYGVVSKRNLLNKQKAIFLDRDGTINKYVGFLKDINDFELVSGVSTAIKRINTSSYLAIVITNQPVIARGDVSFSQLDEIHKKMETELGKDGAYLDDIYFCPHHPHKGYDGEVPELKIDCNCRKPKIGMILKAVEKYNIDLSQSWFVGDTSIDVQTGKNAGTKTILIKSDATNENDKYNVVPNYEVDSINEAIDIALQQE